MRRYYYYIEEKDNNENTFNAFIIKAKDFIEAIDLTQCQFKNKKLSIDIYSDISSRIGIMIRRISKEDKDMYLNSSVKVKYVKNIILERSKLNKYNVYDKGDGGMNDREFYVASFFAKNKKKAIKMANKKGNYGLGRMGFFSIKKVKNEYK